MSIDTFLLSADTTDLNYPEVRPTLDLNFARVKALDPRITFTRASGGSYVGADGLIKLAGVNQARFDHDPSTGESLGLLVEESRSNIYLQSENFNTSPNATTNSTITANATTSPDASVSADKLVENSSTGNKEVYQSIGTITSGTYYTVSVFAKSAERTLVRIAMDTPRFGSSTNAYFNLTSGTVTLTTGGVTSASIISYPNGWYRCVATMLPTSSGTGNVFITLVQSGTTTNYTGDGTSGIYIWGAQLEAGAFPTSYIPTVASTRTRAGDDASITGKNFSEWYRQDEGTVYFDGTIPAITNDTIGRLIYGFSGGFNFSNSIYIGKSQTSLFISPQIIFNNVGYIFISFPSLTSNRLKTILALSKFNISCKSDLNSSVVTASTTIPNLPTVDRLQLGAEPWNSPNKFNRNVGTIKRFTYFPKRLPDAQLQALTR